MTDIDEMVENNNKMMIHEKTDHKNIQSLKFQETGGFR